MKKVKLSIAAALLFFAGSAFAQVDYTFTNCGSTGQYGPTPADATTEYAGTTLEGAVTVVDGIQYWTVPSTSIYGIEVFGAQGGDDGGVGARMYGEFELTAGTELKILVGQAGGTMDGQHGSGGGGTFVVLAADNSPLIIAGGGGGHGKGSPGIDETSNGWVNMDGRDSETTPGGTAGGGGAAASGTFGGDADTDGGPSGGSTWSSGGGGLLTDGGTYASGSLHGGIAFVDGGIGGQPGSGGNSPGGFGGGGGCGDRGAGGGGYSGGAGGTNNNVGGAGGGSYNDGANQDNETGVRAGHGLAVITALCNPMTVTASETEICFGDEITLSATAESGETVVWDMGVEDGVAFVPDAVGEITYTASTDNEDDCNGSITILVNELPVVYGATTPDDGGTGVGTIDILVDGGLPAYTYDWDNDGTGDFDDAEDLTGLTTGIYVVTVLDANDCQSQPESFFVSDLAGIDGVEPVSVNVYPNPATDQLTIELKGSEQMTFLLLDVTGKVIYNGLVMPNNITTIDLTSLEVGTYFVQLPHETIKVMKR